MTYFPDITLMKASKPEDKYNWYRVREDSEYTEIGVTIPEGFITDFASIPRFFWNILPPHGQAMAPSVLHDYFYTVHPFSYKMNAEEERKYADELFYKMLLAQGIKKWQAKIMYKAVRWFGKKRFENNGKK
jgi:hypothetical protein